VSEAQNLHFGARILNTKVFNADLMELTKVRKSPERCDAYLSRPAALWRLISKHWPRIKQPLWQMLVQLVSDKGSGDAGGALRPQRKLVISAVPEGVHLLLHNVRQIAKRALKHLLVLEHRGMNLDAV
jgi:hypothetical protein